MKTQSQGAQSTGEWLMNTIKQNPEGLLLVAAGAVLMMRQKSGNVGFASNSVRAEIDSGRETVAQPANVVSEAMSDVYNRTQDFGRSMGEQSKQLLQNTNSVVGNTVQRVVDSQPFAVALAGLAAGATVAAVLPVTQVEKHALAPAGEQLTNQVKDAATKASEKLTEVAKDRVTEGLKTVASEVAGAFGQSFSASDRR